MMRLLVIGDKAKLTPLLRQKLVSEAEKDNPRIEIGRFVFLAENLENAVGLEDIKSQLVPILEGITPNGLEAVLMAGNQVLTYAACVIIEQLTGQTPIRIIPRGQDFLVRVGPLGKEGELVQ